MKKLLKEKSYNFVKYYTMVIGIILMSFVIYAKFINQEFGESHYSLIGIIIIILLLIPVFIYDKKKGMYKKK